MAFDLPSAGTVNLEAFDLRGRRVGTLVNAFRNAGRHEVPWTGTDAAGRSLPSGTYLMRLQTLTGDRVIRVALVR